MTFKDGVDRRGVHPRLWTVLPWIDGMHHTYTGEEVTVTSLRRPWKPDVVSKHAPVSPPQRDIAWFTPDQWDKFFCSAVDLRRWELDAEGKRQKRKLAEEFCKYIQREHGDELGVVLEPEWLTAEEIRKRGGIDKIDPHIHTQLKFPVKWRLWG